MKYPLSYTEIGYFIPLSSQTSVQNRTYIFAQELTLSDKTIKIYDKEYRKGTWVEFKTLYPYEEFGVKCRTKYK